MPVKIKSFTVLISLTGKKTELRKKQMSDTNEKNRTIIILNISNTPQNVSGQAVF